MKLGNTQVVSQDTATCSCLLMQFAVDMHSDVAEFDLSGDVAAFSGCGFLGACLVM